MSCSPTTVAVLSDVDEHFLGTLSEFMDLDLKGPVFIVTFVSDCEVMGSTSTLLMPRA